MPFIFLCYVIAYIDRVNIGFAATELQRDLGLSDAAFGLGAGLFFLGYCLFEVPSNLILERVGARRWIARIMIGWGLVSMAMMFASGVWSFYLLRVLLGVAEAGFFPGVILYLTYWVPAAHRARTSALFMTAIPVSVIVGAPISEALLKLDGTLGLRGWQWLFLVEGLPAVLVGVATLFYLTDRPEKAHWLAPDQRDVAHRDDGARAVRAGQPRATRSVLASLRSGKLWLLCAIYFMNTTGDLRRVPVAAAHPPRRVEGQRPVGRLADGAAVCRRPVGHGAGRPPFRSHRRAEVARRHLRARRRVRSAAGRRLPGQRVDAGVSFTLCQLGQRSLLSVFWAIPPIFLGGTAAAAGIALINSLGNLGGSVGPTVVGSLRGSSGNYTSGLLVLAAALVIEAILVASMRLPRQVSPASQSPNVLEHVRQRDHGRHCYSDDDGPVDPVHRVGKVGRRIRAGGGDDVETTGLQQGADRGELNGVGDQLQHSAPVRLPQLDDFQHHKNSAGDCDRDEGGKEARTRCQEGRPRAKQQERIRGHREPPGQDEHGDNQFDHELPDRHCVTDVGAPAAACAGPTGQTAPCARTRRRPARRGRPWRR